MLFRSALPAGTGVLDQVGDAISHMDPWWLVAGTALWAAQYGVRALRQLDCSGVHEVAALVGPVAPGAARETLLGLFGAWHAPIGDLLREIQVAESD